MSKLSVYLTLLSALGLGACGETSRQGSQGLGSEDDVVLELECPDGGAVGDIEVAFACGEVDVESCKDLSNVVLQFADGTTQKFDGLSGTSGTFGGTGENEGKVIVTAWVKAGNNASGDGPGYGERFDNGDAAECNGEEPECEGEACEPPPCEGEACEPPPCEGEACEPPPCEGEACEPPPCEGEACEPPCDEEPPPPPCDDPPPPPCP